MTARLIESRELAPNIRHFVLEAPEVNEFYFVPGQFVSFTQTLENKKITRPYSIASAPHGNRFEVCLNLVEDGLFSPFLFSLKPGDTVEMTAPLGYFVLRNPGRDSIFIATGTGVAPFRSMLKAYLGQGDRMQFTLLFGVRHECSLLYREEFDELAGMHSNFQFWPTLTRPDPAWKGRVGRVQAHLGEALNHRTDVDVYICGLKAMVDEVRAILKGLGFDRKHIIFEKYD